MSPVRKPGRPPKEAAAAVRQSLLEAARDQFVARGYTAASTRDIAAAAAVNPAMIHYYFGGKRGLYTALLQHAAEPLLARLEALPAQDDHPGLEPVITVIVEALSANPWIATLLVREVLSAEGPLREEFIRTVASHTGPLLRKRLERAQAHGHLASEDPALAALSIIALCVFPFVAAPVARPVLGIRYDAGFAARLIRHNVALLHEGMLR